MHNSLKGLDERILRLALAALTRANTDSVFVDPGMEHRELLAPLSAAHAGELLLKALIAREHPLLIFKSLHNSSTVQDVDLNWLLSKGQTHDFSALPSILKASTGITLPDQESFDLLRKTRNQIQHFMAPKEDLRVIALDFIYKNIDPLLFKYFDEYAFEFHEDDFDDYVAITLLVHQYKFSAPSDFEFSEVDPMETLEKVSASYRLWAIQKFNLIDG